MRALPWKCSRRIQLKRDNVQTWDDGETPSWGSSCNGSAGFRIHVVLSPLKVADFAWLLEAKRIKSSQLVLGRVKSSLIEKELFDERTCPSTWNRFQVCQELNACQAQYFGTSFDSFEMNGAIHLRKCWRSIYKLAEGVKDLNNRVAELLETSWSKSLEKKTWVSLSLIWGAYKFPTTIDRSFLWSLSQMRSESYVDSKLTSPLERKRLMAFSSFRVPSSLDNWTRRTCVNFLLISGPTIPKVEKGSFVSVRPFCQLKLRAPLASTPLRLLNRSFHGGSLALPCSQHGFDPHHCKWASRIVS